MPTRGCDFGEAHPIPTRRGWNRCVMRRGLNRLSSRPSRRSPGDHEHADHTAAGGERLERLGDDRPGERDHGP